jgi:hypothetical protein
VLQNGVSGLIGHICPEVMATAMSSDSAGRIVVWPEVKTGRNRQAGKDQETDYEVAIASRPVIPEDGDHAPRRQDDFRPTAGWPAEERCFPREKPVLEWARNSGFVAILAAAW